MSEENYHRDAKVLVATWRLASDNDMIPVSYGTLDKTLKLSINDGVFGENFSDLDFVEGIMGVECVQLSCILSFAEEAELISQNISFGQAHIKISKVAAMRILEGLSVKFENVKIWGEILMKNLKLIEKENSDFTASLNID